MVIIALLLGVCPSAFAQYTPMPHPLIQWFTNAGAVANGYGLCVFRAGTTTLATTYATSTGTANTNPILMNSAGRATSGGVFLVPGESYKFVYKDDSVTTCVPDTGVTLFTVDNVSAVPGSASSVDVSNATAGESIAAGDAVFLSNGSNSLNAGQWYRTDSDFTYKSTMAAMVGIAPSAISSGASGSIRVAGAVTVTGPLSAGAAYYAGATPGAIVTTPPTNAIRLGVAPSATSFIVGYQAAPVSPRGPPCGRLTISTGVPVPPTDVTAATTVYYAPYNGCNQLSLFDGTQWNPSAFAQLSIAVPATTSSIYDVFAYDNAGVIALELSTAWTSDTARFAAGPYATLLPEQNGVKVKSTNGTVIDNTRLYLGTFRTTTVSGQTEDSFTKRYVWNYYNRVRRDLVRTESAGTWTYTTATVRQANDNTTNQVDIVVGVQEVTLDLSLVAIGVNDTAQPISTGIGEGSTTVYVAPTGAVGSTYDTMSSRLVKYPAIGRQFYTWCEWSTAAGTSTWYSTASFGSTVYSGLRGWIEG